MSQIAEPKPAPWAEDQGSTLEELTKKIFFGDVERLHISQAIRANLRVGDTTTSENEKLRNIPKDYVTLKSSSKLKKEELSARFLWWKEVHDLRAGNEHGKTPMENWSMDKLKEILDNFRELLYLMSLPIINTHFSFEFNKKFPGLKFGNGRCINTIDDYCDFIYTYNPRAPDTTLNVNECRAMTHFVLYGMWGKSNFWAEKGETQILTMLGLTYDGNRMSDGYFMKRKQRGGFVKTLSVKKLDMERNKVSEAWSRVNNEKIFHRDVFKSPSPSNDPAKKRKRPDKSDLRRYIVKCRMESHGFDGNYLMLEDHPDRLEMTRLERNGKVSVQPKEHSVQPKVRSAEETKKELVEMFSKMEHAKLNEVLKSLIGGGTTEIAAEEAVQGPPAKMRRLPAGNCSVNLNSTGNFAGNFSSAVSDGEESPKSVDVADRVSLEEATEEFGDSPLQGIDLSEKVDEAFLYNNTSTGQEASTTEPTVPGSPANRRKIRNSPRNTPPAGEPLKKGDGVNCECPDHGKVKKYGYFNNTYFTKPQREKPNWPTQCKGCSAVFTLKNMKGGNYYKVTDMTPVYACSHCFLGKPGVKCDHAFCSPCRSLHANSTTIEGV